jgi:UDP-N-acetylmuramate--alanine ligase
MKVFIGHSPDNIKGSDLVVYSTAIPQTNPEIIASKEMGIPLIHRAQILGDVTQSYESIGVLGTHGKGTVATTITWILEKAGLNPSFIIGGILNNFGTNARLNTGKYLVAEVDESDGSHVHVQTKVVVINNIEMDHLNYYKDWQAIIQRIAQSIRENPKLQYVFYNADDEGCRKVIDMFDNPPFSCISYGRKHPADYQLRDIATDRMASTFNILGHGEDFGRFALCLPGEYNVENALAGFAVCHTLGISPDAIRDAFLSFLGLENRFTVVEAAGIGVVKDYISHPTGIRRVLKACRELDHRQIIAIFKPYRFTLIHYLQDEYQQCFRDADHIVITEMYTAGEVPIPGINEDFLINKIREAGGKVTFIREMSEIDPFLMKIAAPDDIIVFLGGDDLFREADKLVAMLKGTKTHD